MPKMIAPQKANTESNPGAVNSPQAQPLILNMPRGSWPRVIPCPIMPPPSRGPIRKTRTSTPKAIRSPRRSLLIPSPLSLALVSSFPPRAIFGLAKPGRGKTPGSDGVPSVLFPECFANLSLLAPGQPHVHRHQSGKHHQREERRPLEQEEPDHYQDLSPFGVLIGIGGALPGSFSGAARSSPRFPGIGRPRCSWRGPLSQRCRCALEPCSPSLWPRRGGGSSNL